MKRTLLVTLGVWAMVFQVMLGQDRSDPAAETMLAQAVAAMKTCPFTTTKHVYDGDGHEIGADDEREEHGYVDKLSIPLLFRSGRFALKLLANSEMPTGRPVRVIAYEPLPERKQMKTGPGNENGDLNKVFNHLKGSVFLDPETGAVVRVDAALPQEVTWQVWIVSVFKLSDLTFTYKQEIAHERWMPATLGGMLKYWRVDRRHKKDRNIQKEFVATFACG